MLHIQEWELAKHHGELDDFTLGHFSLGLLTYDVLKDIEQNDGKELMQEKFLQGFDEDGKEIWAPYGLVGELNINGSNTDLGLMGVFIQEDFHILPRHFMSCKDLIEFCEKIKREQYPELKI